MNEVLVCSIVFVLLLALEAYQWMTQRKGGLVGKVLQLVAVLLWLGVTLSLLSLFPGLNNFWRVLIGFVLLVPFGFLQVTVLRHRNL